MTLSGDEVRAAQILTGSMMVVWLLAGAAPGLRRQAPIIRAVTLAVYLAGCASFLVWLALRD